MEELGEIVEEWAKKLKSKYFNPIKRNIFNTYPNQRYVPFLHCEYPHSDPKLTPVIEEDVEGKKTLTGGASGYDIIKQTFNFLKDGEEQLEEYIRAYQSDNPPYERILEISRSKKLKEEDAIEYLENAKANFYLLDAPIGRKDGRFQLQNWVMQECLERLKNRFAMRISVGMELIDISDHERSKKYPSEIKMIKYNVDLSKCATVTSDYGFIIKTLNPFNENFMVLMMAGLHAPATHMAAEIFFVPNRFQQFIEKYELGGGELDEYKNYEAVFKINRNYDPTYLNDPEFIYFRKLK